MMNKYGLAAVSAVKKILNGEFDDPREAWDSSLAKYYDQSSSSFQKGCPRNAFLGLCEEGIVKGIKSGNYTKSKNNKNYALRAVAIIQNDPSLINDVDRLWNNATGKSKLTHNSQMNVVIDLYNNGLIINTVNSDANQK